MASLREKIAGMAQIGSVKFWATRAAPQPNPRRIAQYTGVGVTGASTDDLGQNARVETLMATVEETVYEDLDNIKREGKVVTCIHPLFGLFEGRVVDVVYDAGPPDMIDITVTLIEHGDPTALFFFYAALNNPAAARQNLDAAFGNLSLDDLGDAPTSSGIPSAASSLSSQYAAMSSVMDLVSSGDALLQDASSAFTEFASAADSLIEAVDGFTDATADMIDQVDTIYESVNAAREYVSSVERQLTSVWQNVLIRAPLSVAEIAAEFMPGVQADEAIDQILDRNPSIVDLLAVPIGIELSIPVSP